MLRRTLLAVPAVAVVAALLGVVLADRPALVAVVATVLGVVVGVGLTRVAEARVGRVAERVERFAEGDTARADLPDLGSGQWRRLSAAMSAADTALEQRFAELAGERARVERLLEDLPLAVVLFTRDGLAYANPAAGQLLGVAEGAGRTPLQVLGIPGLADAVAEAEETGRTVEVEVAREDRELAGRASVPAAGEVMLVVTDLTETRRIEAIRRDFVTNASHELKTPVAGIQALSESLVLALERDPARGRRMIDRLQTEAARLAQLVRDLLDLARLEEATGQRARQRVDLARVVAAQVDRLEGFATRRGVTMEVEALGDAPLIAVPEDLRLITANLLDNAVQHNREGGWVRVRVERRGSEVVLEVADNGLGIPEADRDRIFERFYRVDKGRSRAAGGTGLGLAIVRHAAQRHGGSVSVRSVLGEGSTFRVLLPVDGGE